MSSFLRRWSDRKDASRQQPQDADDPAPASPDASPDAPPADKTPDDATAASQAAALAERLAELPAIETITAETDIRPFLQDFVPAALRNAALRRAWLADPVISTHLDVARDYAWDFNTGNGPGGFYRKLGQEVAARGLAALKTTTLHDRDQPPESPPAAAPAPSLEASAVIPDDPPAGKTDADARPDHDDTDPAGKILPPLKPARKHGGALPD